jgi:hypothetical protein
MAELNDPNNVAPEPMGESKPIAEGAVDLPAAPAPPAESPAAPPPPHGEQHAARTIGHILKQIVIRTWAMAILLVLGWAGYLSVSYLLHFVFVPTAVPDKFINWEGRSDMASLRSNNAPGLTAPAERAPITHYHRVEPWYQHDPRNGCTYVGCHDPLPHTKKQKVPAFANFHATFLSCQMCHAANGSAAGAATWVSTTDERTQQAPALLQLLRYLETSDELVKKDPAKANPTILALLRGTAAIIPGEPSLRNMLYQLEASEPGSPVWRSTLERLRRELPAHARGEYGAKVARETAPGAYQSASNEMRSLAARYLGAAVGSNERAELKENIHETIAKEPVTCLSCHGQKPGMIDFEALGYSPSRARLLSNLQLANLMQRIRQGEQFFIPKLLGGGDAKD